MSDETPATELTQEEKIINAKSLKEQGYSNSHIAYALGIPVSSVRTYLKN